MASTGLAQSSVWSGKIYSDGATVAVAAIDGQIVAVSVQSEPRANATMPIFDVIDFARVTKPAIEMRQAE